MSKLLRRLFVLLMHIKHPLRHFKAIEWNRPMTRREQFLTNALVYRKRVESDD